MLDNIDGFLSFLKKNSIIPVSYNREAINIRNNNSDIKKITLNLSNYLKDNYMNYIIPKIFKKFILNDNENISKNIHNLVRIYNRRLKNRKLKYFLKWILLVRVIKHYNKVNNKNCFNRLYNNYISHRKNKEILKYKYLSKEEDQCTFKPKINDDIYAKRLISNENYIEDYNNLLYKDGDCIHSNRGQINNNKSFDFLSNKTKSNNNIKIEEKINKLSKMIQKNTEEIKLLKKSRTYKNLYISNPMFNSNIPYSSTNSSNNIIDNLNLFSQNTRNMPGTLSNYYKNTFKNPNGKIIYKSNSCGNYGPSLQRYNGINKGEMSKNLSGYNIIGKTFIENSNVSPMLSNRSNNYSHHLNNILISNPNSNTFSSHRTNKSTFSNPSYVNIPRKNLNCQKNNIIIPSNNNINNQKNNQSTKPSLNILDTNTIQFTTLDKTSKKCQQNNTANTCNGIYIISSNTNDYIESNLTNLTNGYGGKNKSYNLNDNKYTKNVRKNINDNISKYVKNQNIFNKGNTKNNIGIIKYNNKIPVNSIGTMNTMNSSKSLMINSGYNNYNYYKNLNKNNVTNKSILSFDSGTGNNDRDTHSYNLFNDIMSLDKNLQGPNVYKKSSKNVNHFNQKNSNIENNNFGSINTNMNNECIVFTNNMNTCSSNKSTGKMMGSSISLKKYNVDRPGIRNFPCYEKENIRDLGNHYKYNNIHQFNKNISSNNDGFKINNERVNRNEYITHNEYTIISNNNINTHVTLSATADSAIYDMVEKLIPTDESIRGFKECLKKGKRKLSKKKEIK